MLATIWRTETRSRRGSALKSDAEENEITCAAEDNIPPKEINRRDERVLGDIYVNKTVQVVGQFDLLCRPKLCFGEFVRVPEMRVLDGKQDEPPVVFLEHLIFPYLAALGTGLGLAFVHLCGLLR